MLVCEAAAALMHRHSKGVQRIPLDRMGISPFNRRINGPYVHKLGKRILTVEGFARLRYQQGWCHEPNPEDPLAVARCTNAAAKGSGLLAPVPMVPLFGSFAKSHLLSFLQALKCGQIFWNDTRDLMLPEPATQELLEHLEHGMFYEVLGWEACEDDGDALRALIASDNFDAGFALGQTEMHLLMHIRLAIVVERPPVGSTLLDVVRQKVAGTSGQHWTDADIACFYSAAVALGDEHLAFLSELCDMLVSVDRIAVRPQDFAAAAALAPEVPWLKVALLATQYMSPDNRLREGTRGRAFGNVIGKDMWEKMRKAKAADLEPAEAFLRSVRDRYSLEAVRGVSRSSWFEAVAAIFVKVASLVACAKDFAQVPAGFTKVEDKLVEKLTRPGIVLPERLTQRAPPATAGAVAKPTAGAVGKTTAGAVGEPLADTGPPLTFVGGKLVHDFANEARCKGLVPGASVRCEKAHPGVDEGVYGQVEALHEDRVVVRWNLPPGEKNLLPCLDLAALVVAEQPPPPPPPKAPSAKEVAMRKGQTLLAMPIGVVWSSSMERDTRQACAAFLSSVLWELHTAHNISGAELRWWEVAPGRVEAAGAASGVPSATVEAAGAAPAVPTGTVEAAGAASVPSWACAAVTDLKAGRLALVPWPVAVLPDAPEEVSAGQVVISVGLKFGDASDTIYLVGPPRRTAGEVTDTPDGAARLLYPFWDIIGAEQGEGQELSIKYESVDIPLHAYSAGKALFARRTGKKEFLRVSVPFWTNEASISLGDRLWVRPNALSPAKAKEGANATLAPPA